MITTLDILGKIVAEHAGKPKFVGTVGLSADPFVRMQALLYGLVPAFDLDTAVGVQLDAVGVRVGCSRDIPVAIENITFSWDVDAKGWDQGSWDQGFANETAIVKLTDDDYRRLLYARVLANRFDGTAVMAQQILDVFFDDPATIVFVEDDGIVAYPRNFFTWDAPNSGWDTAQWAPLAQGTPVGNLAAVDMSAVVGVAGKRPPLVYLALLGLGLIPIKPAGVDLAYLVTSVDDTPLFGFDLETDAVSGWDVGSWGVSPYDPASPLYSDEGIVGQLDFSRSSQSGLSTILTP